MPYKSFLIFCVFITGLTSSLFSQKNTQVENDLKFESKVSELYRKYKKEDFLTYKGGNIQMKKNTEFPIFIELIEGRWYQFAVIGDPEANKIEMKLGLEGVGHIITDKFKPGNTDEFWTDFSFICPRSGRYLMTFYQKASKKDLKGHVAVLQKCHLTDSGLYTYR